MNNTWQSLTKPETKEELGVETMIPFCDIGADIFVPSYTNPIPETESRTTFLDSFEVEFTAKTTVEEIIGLVLREVIKICPTGTLAIFERKLTSVGVDKFTLSGKIYRYAEETTASA